MKCLKTVFFGSDSIVLPTLDFLISPASPLELVGVFSQPDRPRGRGQKCLPNVVSAWALAHGIPLRRPEKLGPEDTQWLKDSGADIALVMAYGHLLKPDFLAVPALGFLNLHGSLLPAYRGASPITAAIAQNLSMTGVSLMRVVAAMDAGAVCDTESFALDPEDTCEDARIKAAAACVPLLARALPSVLDGTARFTEQDAALVSYTRKVDKADGILDFSRPACELAARVRALSPWPACGVDFEGTHIKIFEARAFDEAHAAIPGTVLHAGEHGLRVAAGEGILNLTQLQRPGGKRLCAAEFLRGFPIKIGTIFPSVPMPPLVSPTPFPRKRGNVSFDKPAAP